MISKRGTCFTVENAFSAEECRSLIARMEAKGYAKSDPTYPPSYRSNDRLVLDDDRLAAQLFERLRSRLPQTLVDGDGVCWRLVGLNERFRCCRYLPGQHFSIHRDGVYYRRPWLRSRLTFMVYLNDASEFTGGSTRFFPSRRDTDPPLLVVRPSTGTLIVFDHTLWHDGERVTAGRKYILRSDILYEREDRTESDDRHSGYVWSLAELPDGRLVSGGRDKTIRLWRREGTRMAACGMWPAHANSVTAVLAVSEREIWTASRDCTVRAWRLDGDVLSLKWQRQAHAGAVLALCRFPDGAVASGGADGTIALWSPTGELMVRWTGHQSWIWSLAVLSDDLLASASEDGTLRLWSRPACREIARGASQGPLRVVVALPGGGLATGAVGGAIEIWERQSDRLARAGTLAGHDSDVRALAVLPDGSLASGGEDDSIRLWKHARLLTHGDFVTSLRVLADGTLASASYDGTIRLWA